MSLDSYIGGVEGINVGSYDLNDATNKSLEGSHSGSSLIDQLLSDSESNQASDNASNDVDDEEDDEDTEDNADENEDENADEDEDNDEIMKDDELDADTLVAQKEEAERRRRLLEVKKALEQKMKEREEKDSQLKSLLQSEETKGEDVILLDSSDEGRQRPRSRDNDIIELSSDEEDDEDDDDEDDVTITKEDEDNDADSEDPNNAGSHINDELNVPDDVGRILVNIGHSSEEEDIYLAPQIAKFIKRHQNLIESINRYNSSPGFGCILAHSMGLGKTIQMISFIDIFLRFAKAKTVLLIVPINTLQNWMAEFNMWCPPKEVVGEGNSEVIPRNFGVFLLNENYKTTSARAKVIDKWYKEGGVLLMGYEMYRLLSSRRGHIADKVKKPGRKPANPVVIDVEEEYKNKGLLIGQ
ncbi:hypothetical protein FSP39_023138 [Pinctada imbricata]|uniref:SNF2 N-terminal domain-containing protein n=1 Tax=Pinctada imbricata TaxID=66713 RepID=A0AA88YMR8_PINIB|nr:hypothetical protein FSP39_023138 [Pinctada imbricata]